MLNLPAARVNQDCWEIPPLREGRLYLAVDASHQAAPCLVGEHSPVEQGGQYSFLESVALTDERERSTNLLGFFRRVTAEPEQEFHVGQIDVCLDWMGRFQHVLTWLHPFLVLALHPEIALKILILARLRGHIKAEQGLRWSLDEVPLFWHQLAGLDSAKIPSWNHAQFTEETRNQAQELIKELPFQEILGQLSCSPLPLLQATHSAWRDEWQRRVQSWGDQANGRLGIRSSEIARSAELLWNSLAEAPELKTLLEVRCQQVPEGIEELHRTYLLAPFELAASIVHCLELPAHLRDDLIYARYVISPDAFDSAFCVAKILMERMK